MQLRPADRAGRHQSACLATTPVPQSGHPDWGRGRFSLLTLKWRAQKAEGQRAHNSLGSGNARVSLEPVDTLSQKEREERGRFLAKGRARKPVRPLDQAQLLASIRQRRSFCPNDYDLPDSLLVLREDRER